MKSRKKTKLVLVALLAVVTIVSALMCGCSLFDNFDEVQSISLIGTPKTVYAVGDEFDPAGAKVEISYRDKTEGVTKALTADNFDIQFSTEKVGTYKCVVAYKDGGKVYNDITLSFDYSVVAKDGSFTEGDGSQSSPYVVYTAEQFAQIGAEVGKYYVLGGNIDLTKVSPVKKDSWADCYNTNSGTFILDGQNYSLTINGTDRFAFYVLNGSTVKNLVFNINPGSVEVALALTIQGNEVVFENVTINGSMRAEQNDGMLAVYLKASNVVVNGCVNNANVTGGATTYYGAFFGIAYNTVKNVTFENCVNNGSLDGTTAWIFIGNCASQIKGQVNVINCRNTGKLVGASVGLFNCSGATAVGARTEKEDYPADMQKKIGEIDFTYEESDFVAIPYLLYKDNHDVTLVKKDGVVKFADSVKAKLDGEFGEDNYTVKTVVRDWVRAKIGIDDKTVYVYTNSYGLDFVAPYTLVENGTEVTTSVNGAITIKDGKLVLSGTMMDGYTYLTDGKGTSQYYCYYVYDNTGAMRYCGQIAYADVQNA